MQQALGLVEVEGLGTAIATCDVMIKAANVSIIETENTKGGGFTVIKIEGDVGAVTAACQAGCSCAGEKLVSVKVIPRPAEMVREFFAKQEIGRTVLYRR